VLRIRDNHFSPYLRIHVVFFSISHCTSCTVYRDQYTLYHTTVVITAGIVYQLLPESTAECTGKQVYTSYEETTTIYSHYRKECLHMQD